MKKLSLAIIAFALCGCTTPSTTPSSLFVTPDGKFVRCAAQGWGYVGTPMAQSIHDKCVSDLKYSGALPVSVAGGIGVVPSSDTNAVRILKIIPNSSAEASGIKAGSSITKVNDQSVTNWNDARRLLFGRAGTDLTVTIFDGVTQNTIQMTRGRVYESVANEANN